MKIALDYDLTYSLDPVFWNYFIRLCRSMDHDVRIVTVRDERFDRTAPLKDVETITDVIYTRGAAKKWYLTHFGDGFIPDVWIDDKPETILENSTATPEILVEWRKNRNEEMA